MRRAWPKVQSAELKAQGLPAEFAAPRSEKKESLQIRRQQTVERRTLSTSISPQEQSHGNRRVYHLNSNSQSPLAPKIAALLH
jgi:hypothetical protein